MRCVGFSLRWLHLLRSTGSRYMGSVIVAHRLSYCVGRWNLPGPGIEPLSLALSYEFLTTRPLRKSWKLVFYSLLGRKFGSFQRPCICFYFCSCFLSLYCEAVEEKGVKKILKVMKTVPAVLVFNRLTHPGEMD